MACGITSGVSVTCDDLRRVGGVNKRAFIFNLSDVTGYTTTVDGCISAITFDVATGLYEFDSRKFAHSGGYSVQSGGEGGNKFYQHDVQLKMFSTTCLDDKILEDLLVANVGIILETANQDFKLFGTYNGMSEESGQQNSGQVGASDVSDTLIFQGEEKGMPKHVLDTDYETTKTYLEGLVV